MRVFVRPWDVCVCAVNTVTRASFASHCSGHGFQSWSVGLCVRTSRLLQSVGENLCLKCGCAEHRQRLELCWL